jgi:hypothetical protein
MAPASRKRARSPSEVPDELFESHLFPVGSHIFLIFISLFQLGYLLYFSQVLLAGCCPVVQLCPLIRRSRFSAVVTAAKVRGPGCQSSSRAKRLCERSLIMSLSMLVMGPGCQSSSRAKRLCERSLIMSLGMLAVIVRMLVFF